MQGSHDDDEVGGDPMSFTEHFEKFIARDASELEYFARRYSVDADVISGITTADEFFAFLVTALGEDEKIWQEAIWSILQFCKFDIVESCECRPHFDISCLLELLEFVFEFAGWDFENYSAVFLH